MFEKHQESCEGDFSFMEELIPEGVCVHHMDSYNIDGKIRFQGSFYYQFPKKKVACNEAPKELLKKAINYSIDICGCDSKPHLTWSIWF